MQNLGHGLILKMKKKMKEDKKVYTYQEKVLGGIEILIFF